MQVQYGTHSLDFTSLPPKSLEAMLKRGVTHFLGNEQAAKVTNWKKKFVEEHGAEPGEDELQAKKAEYVIAALAALNEGTVGTASRGPAIDPLDAEMERLAKAEINDIIKKAGAKFSGKGDDRKVTFGDGSSFTMDELIDRRLNNPDHAARIQKAAEKALKEKAKAVEAAKSSGPISLDAIG
jgi:hypothetical protein